LIKLFLLWAFSKEEKFIALLLGRIPRSPSLPSFLEEKAAKTKKERKTNR
jgi:hypothetical protein